MMSWLQVIVLSIVQGLTEFLPVSSSGHLRIVSELFWGEDAGASFTAVIQLGTELAVLVYFAKDIIGDCEQYQSDNAAYQKCIEDGFNEKINEMEGSSN